MLTKKIGIIGYGFIGSSLYQRIKEQHDDIEVSWIYNRTRESLSNIPQSMILENLEEYRQYSVDLIVEAAHPNITARYASQFLQDTDYMPVSVNGLADTDTLLKLKTIAKKNGTRLYIPHGGLMGIDNLLERREKWKQVSITLKKNTDNISLSSANDSVKHGKLEKVLYEGDVAGIAKQFPQNVNMMVACALASNGVDKCRAKLISDPSLNHGIAEIEALTEDGARLFMRKEQPMVGVSGSEMCDSIYFSVTRALNCYQPVSFV